MPKEMNVDPRTPAEIEVDQILWNAGGRPSTDQLNAIGSLLGLTQEDQEATTGQTIRRHDDDSLRGGEDGQ